VTPVYGGGGYYVLASSGKVYAFGDAAAPRGVGPAGVVLPGNAVAIVGYRSPRTRVSDSRRPASTKRSPVKRK
jgi:hypothetical protein